MTRAGLVAFLLLTGFLAACSPRAATHGNLLTDGQMSEIKVGLTTKSDLVRLVGPPSAQGTFDSRVWYYIGRQVTQWAFFNPNVKQQKSIAVHFDRRDVVERVEFYGKDDTRTVDVVDRVTPTSGRSLGFFEQIFGNIGVIRR